VLDQLMEGSPVEVEGERERARLPHCEASTARLPFNARLQADTNPPSELTPAQATSAERETVSDRRPRGGPAGERGGGCEVADRLWYPAYESSMKGVERVIGMDSERATSTAAVDEVDSPPPLLLQ
jgi:hypothetical protein